MDILATGERALLEGMVDRQRSEIAALLDDLTEAEARQRLVPSLTTPLGLVKHCAFVERVWFHSRVADVPRTDLGIPDAVDDSFVLTDADSIASVRSDFLDACERSRTIAASHGLGETFPWHAGDVSLRYVYAHLIAEYARHAGHGDILVEQITAARIGD
jgi:hypothetical protein